MPRRAAAVALMGILASASVLADTINPLPYNLIYVRAPRFGNALGPGERNSVWPEVATPLVPDPGAELLLLRSDGQREVLFPLEPYRSQVDTPVDQPLSVGSVSDPNVSFDAQWVLFTWYHDLRPENGNDQRDGLSRSGADLYKLNLQTRVLVRLTRQEFTPNTGNGARFDAQDPDSNHPQIGVFNTGGTWAPGGRIVFTSSRNNLLPPKTMTSVQRVMQLFAMDNDGRNVEQIGHFNLAMALHPQVLLDGRIAFTSWEEHGLRDTRQFALWALGPDGRGFTNLSGFAEAALAHHFMTQMPGGDIVVCRYYNFNNNGFGDLIRYPLDPPGPDFETDDPDPETYQIPHARVGQRRLTPFTTPDDIPAPCPGWEDDPYGSTDASACHGTERRGKVTHPAATPAVPGAGGPGAELLVVYSPGPANHRDVYVAGGSAFPWYHGQIVLVPDGEPVLPPWGASGRPPQLVSVVIEDGKNLQWPRPVVTYRQLYGVDEPGPWPDLTDQQIASEGLTPGEPFGLIGTSSLIWRDTRQALYPYSDDRDPFAPPNWEEPYSWVRQGSDAGLYSDDDIYAVRILMQQASTDRLYPWNDREFDAVGGERMRILGEIPVRGSLSGKPGSPTSTLPDGRVVADTSFLAKIPADTSVTFQTLDRRGMVLNMAQTWHQVRPGEAHYNCGGCHAHSKAPLDFATTAAAQAGYTVRDLARTTPLLTMDPSGQPGLTTAGSRQVSVEYFRDVLPIFNGRCSSCHGATNPAGGLPLTGAATNINGWPAAYYRLVLDRTNPLGPPFAQVEGGYAVQSSKYIRSFQSRQSLLMWAVWNQRLDGRTNATRTTDLDFSGHPAIPNLTSDERFTLARWIDLGSPIDLVNFEQPNEPPIQQPFWGFLEDDVRPALVLRPGLDGARFAGSVGALEIAAFDVESGLVPASLEVTCDRQLGGFAAGANLAGGLSLDPGGGVLRLTLPRAVTITEEATFTVRVRDNAGHRTELKRTYGPDPRIPALFADVLAGYWARPWIEALYRAGVTSGCATNPLRYCPEGSATRGQMAVFLLRSKEGRDYAPPSCTVPRFTDVPCDSPFADWIGEIAARGVTSGCSASPPLYCPTSPVTRGQMAVFLLRTLLGAGYVPPPANGDFEDVPPAHPFAPWIEELAARGITSGCSVSPPRYCPTNLVTRAQMAVFLVRTFTLPM